MSKGQVGNARQMIVFVVLVFFGVFAISFDANLLTGYSVSDAELSLVDFTETQQGATGIRFESASEDKAKLESGPEKEEEEAIVESNLEAKATFENASETEAIYESASATDMKLESGQEEKAIVESNSEDEVMVESASATDTKLEGGPEEEAIVESTSEEEAIVESTSEEEAIFESASETETRDNRTETNSQDTTESQGNQYDYLHHENELIRRKLEMYNALIELQQARAIESPGSPQQVRHTIQQLPKMIDGTSYYAVDARLDAGKQRVVLDFVFPFPVNESVHFKPPSYRRTPPIVLSTGNRRAKYFIRDCRVRSLLTGKVFGNEAYLSVVDDDETSMFWQENKLNSADHRLAPMEPCGRCKWRLFTKPKMRYNKRRTFQIHCRIWKWVSDLLALHAGTGVFQFDFAIDDQNDKARTFKVNQAVRRMGKAEVWPTLPGIALDIPLTSYSHHSFRDVEFRGNPVKLNEDRNSSVAACITVSAPNSRLLLSHADQLLLHGVEHIFYLPMMKSAYGIGKHNPDLRTDPEEYFEHYLEMENVLANRKGFVTFSKPWLFPMFDVSSAHMQILGLNSCYGHAMNMGYDWVFVLDVDEFLSPDYTTPLDIPVSNLTSPPPVATGVKPKAKPWLQRILEAYDPTKLCELRIERFRYKAKHKVPEENYHWLPENMTSITIGRTALSPMRMELDGKSILGRNILLTGVHQGFCADDSREALTVPLSQGVLIHSSEVFGMDFNEGI